MGNFMDRFSNVSYYSLGVEPPKSKPKVTVHLSDPGGSDLVGPMEKAIFVNDHVAPYENTRWNSKVTLS